MAKGYYGHNDEIESFLWNRWRQAVIYRVFGKECYIPQKYLRADMGVA